MIKIYNEKYERMEKKIVVPFFLIGKMMDYAHHNVQQHHYSADYTIAQLQRRFWWNSLKSDVKWFMDNCIFFMPICKRIIKTSITIGSS